MCVYTSPHLAIHTTCNRINVGTQIPSCHCLLAVNLLMDMFNHVWRERSDHDGLFIIPVLNLFLSLHILLLEVDTCTYIAGWSTGLIWRPELYGWKCLVPSPVQLSVACSTGSDGKLYRRGQGTRLCLCWSARRIFSSPKISRRQNKKRQMVV